MSSLEERLSFALGGGDFDDYREALHGCVAEHLDMLRATAKKRAPDLPWADVLQNTVKKILENTDNQFFGKNVAYRFDPALASFGGYARGLMGGGGHHNWGVIDSMRRKARNFANRSSNLSDEMMDRQANNTGARWNGHDYVTGEVPGLRTTHSVIRKLSFILTSK